MLHKATQGFMGLYAQGFMGLYTQGFMGLYTQGYIRVIMNHGSGSQVGTTKEWAWSTK